MFLVITIRTSPIRICTTATTINLLTRRIIKRHRDAVAWSLLMSTIPEEPPKDMTVSFIIFHPLHLALSNRFVFGSLTGIIKIMERCGPQDY
jgi:hypothetical protein